MNALATNIYNINGELDLLRLADELARNLRPPAEIWLEHGCGRELASKIVASPTFQTMYFEAKARWESTDALPDRVRTKAGVAVEQLIPEMYASALDGKNALNHRVDAFKALARLGRLEPENDNGAAGGGGGVQISINLGNGGQDGAVDDVTVIESVDHADITDGEGAIPVSEDEGAGVDHAGDNSVEAQEWEDFSVDAEGDLDLGDLGLDPVDADGED